jgi:Holliday junction resolvase RusA-like endonuclease
MRLQFTAYGVPQPKGSAQAFGYALKGRDGRELRDAKGHVVVRTKTMSDNPKNSSWQQLVAEAAGQAIALSLLEASPFQLLRGPVVLSAVFYLPRPKYLGAKASVPHAKRPDLSKLLRSVEDAMSRVVWADDGQVWRVKELAKYYAEPEGGIPRVEITVEGDH